MLEYDEPRVLAYTWGDETLRFELEAVGDGTRLVLIDELDSPDGGAQRGGLGDVPRPPRGAHPVARRRGRVTSPATSRRSSPPSGNRTAHPSVPERAGLAQP